MQCPLCIDEVLDTRHRSGVEIDVCPRCRGVWLDRGELDKLAGPVAEIPPPAPTASSPRRAEQDERSRERERDADDRDDDRDDDWDDDDDRDYRRSDRKRRRRLGSWLEDVVEEVFD